MATVISSITQVKKSFHLFINISFLFLLCFFLTAIYINSSSSSSNSHLIHQPKISPILNIKNLIFSSSSTSSYSVINNLADNGKENCSAIYQYNDNEAKCEYVRSNEQCRSRGYIDYLQVYYCICGYSSPFLGYFVLIIWLVLLFYVLGDTAAKYFCSSLESLSDVLRLPPTIAGVTLLSLGNGAPDVFSSIVSFMGTGGSGGGVGLNSVLGAAFFVTSIVVGIISIATSSRGIIVTVDKWSFIRNVVIYLLTLSLLLVIVIVGRINIWGSIAFVSIYFIYVSIVATTHFLRDVYVAPLDDMPLLYDAAIENVPANNPNNEDQDNQNIEPNNNPCCYYFKWFLYVIELPLFLPRRMSIPVVSQEDWSKAYLVISVTLAPIFLVALWDYSQMIYLGAALVIGVVFGTIAFRITDTSEPPTSFRLPWLVVGFLMSVIWTYIIAAELVSLLISFGIILAISPSILGLTVLAWGNSLGDLITNVTLAMTGGPDGAQTAISGCYAGPIFNAIMGLGVAFVFSAWSQYPNSFDIPRDTSLYVTIGFLMAGLVWAIVILLSKNMRLTKLLGGGLVAIYLCFLSLRMIQTLGGGASFS